MVEILGRKLLSGKILTLTGMEHPQLIHSTALMALHMGHSTIMVYCTLCLVLIAQWLMVQQLHGFRLLME